MGCLNCGASPTIRAHLIPQAFAREVRGDDTDHALVRSGGGFRPTKNGLYDDKILCANCDKLLGKHEDFAVGLLKDLRSKTVLGVNYLFDAKEFDSDRFLRFCAGISWKYAVTRLELGRVDLGRYQEILRSIAFGNTPIPCEVDAFLCRLHSGDGESYFYRAPKRDRQFGVNFLRFSVGGFVIFLKLDRRPSPQNLPESNWMRGQQAISFPVLPFDAFEEGVFALGMRTQNHRLDDFLRRVHRDHDNLMRRMPMAHRS